MKSPQQSVIILVTAPTLPIARRLVRTALEQRLIACANIVPRLESHYWWEGKMATSRELLLILKSRKSLVRKLERVIHALHPYDTPEFVILPLTGGSRRYLDWLLSETS